MAEADEIYAAERSGAVSVIGPANVSMPNFGDSEMIPIRFSRPELDRHSRSGKQPHCADKA